MTLRRLSSVRMRRESARRSPVEDSCSGRPVTWEERRTLRRRTVEVRIHVGGIDTAARRLEFSCAVMTENRHRRDTYCVLRLRSWRRLFDRSTLLPPRSASGLGRSSRRRARTLPRRSSGSASRLDTLSRGSRKRRPVGGPAILAAPDAGRGSSHARSPPKWRGSFGDGEHKPAAKGGCENARAAIRRRR